MLDFLLGNAFLIFVSWPVCKMFLRSENGQEAMNTIPFESVVVNLMYAMVFTYLASLLLLVVLVLR